VVLGGTSEFPGDARPQSPLATGPSPARCGGGKLGSFLRFFYDSFGIKGFQPVKICPFDLVIPAKAGIQAAYPPNRQRRKDDAFGIK
jgi:hypothetical protein